MEAIESSKHLVSFVVAILGSVSSVAQAQATRTIELPKQMNVVHLSASPVETGTAIGFASLGGVEPSVSLAVLLSLRSSNSVRSIQTSEVLSGEEIVVWRARSNTVMLETTSGIKEINLETLASIPLVSADTYGLAISPSQGRLAFWKSDGTAYTLEVLELASKKIIREWNLERKYRGFVDRFEMSFDGEDKIFARTYDSESGTPLKQFDVRTGSVSQIAPDCLSVTATSGGIYYLVPQISDKPRLFKLQNPAAIPITVATKAAYDMLADDENAHWLILLNSKAPQSGVLDTTSNKVVKEMPGCSAVTVLADGSFLYAHQNKISSSPSICQEQ